jgi:hypothetical protein
VGDGPSLTRPITIDTIGLPFTVDVKAGIMVKSLKKVRVLQKPADATKPKESDKPQQTGSSSR